MTKEEVDELEIGDKVMLANPTAATSGIIWLVSDRHGDLVTVVSTTAIDCPEEWVKVP